MPYDIAGLSLLYYFTKDLLSCHRGNSVSKCWHIWSHDIIFNTGPHRVAHTNSCHNASPQEAEGRGLLKVQDQPTLLSGTLSQYNSARNTETPEGWNEVGKFLLLHDFFNSHPSVSDLGLRACAPTQVQSVILDEPIKRV